MKNHRRTKSMFPQLLLWVLVAPLSVLAQEFAPLPDKLLAAKSVYLINESRDLKAYDRFFKELKGWNRFVVVTAREKADILMVLSSNDRGGVSVSSGSATASGNVATGSATAVNIPSTFLQLTVSDPSTSEVLWSDETEKWITSGHAPSKLVSNLRKRFPKSSSLKE